MYLLRTIAKYGPDNFRVETLVPVDREDLLNPIERHFIALYNSQNSKTGYNSTAGGDGGRVSEDGRRRCIEASKNRLTREMRDRQNRLETARQEKRLAVLNFARGWKIPAIDANTRERFKSMKRTGKVDIDDSQIEIVSGLLSLAKQLSET